ncbi:hypothetical protein [Pseudoxanthomonas suwonensis]|uniref:HTH luxR-type domain-containing protein n=1 Tax=Pseudoxanthomonas suwonensis TaxID=314722 RepID=A0A0E3Z3R3_9GAMM|nr:hypothetical protein [Pseudoxanthomonas suwonensis]AKC86849.1 hypothetical protein WQ53_08875 [Pseudoxanthomonas suwonensis]
MGEAGVLDELLEPLYGSILEPDRLDEFGLRLARATGSHLTAILGHDVHCGRASVNRVTGADPAQVAAGLQPLNLNEDPWVSRAMPRFATGRVFNTEDLLPNARMRRTDAFNAYYRQFGVEQQVAAVGHYDGSNSVTLSICRDDPNRLFNEAELDLFRQVAPHWVNAYAIMRRMDMLQARVATLETALDRTPVAMFALAADLRMLHANASGERLLAQGVLRRAHGRLTALGRHDPALQLLLARTVQVGTGLCTRDVERLVLKDADGGSLALTAHPLPPLAAGELAAGEAALLVFAQPPGPTGEPGGMERSLRQLFGLTEAETRLALALFRQADLARAARACRIAPSTARTRLKVIFDKTGERSQPALVRLLSALHALDP